MLATRTARIFFVIQPITPLICGVLACCRHRFFKLDKFISIACNNAGNKLSAYWEIGGMEREASHSFTSPKIRRKLTKGFISLDLYKTFFL